MSQCSDSGVLNKERNSMTTGLYRFFATSGRGLMVFWRIHRPLCPPRYHGDCRQGIHAIGGKILTIRLGDRQQCCRRKADGERR